MIFVSESDLYALIVRSRKSEARKSLKCVTKEVLPSILKTGGYSVAPPKDQFTYIDEIDSLAEKLITTKDAMLHEQRVIALNIIGWQANTAGNWITITSR